ncbi:hypothetical protein HDU85_006573 [Gaertneriomyces sp. JEL0708]|nr:hypothetical protein HDU85_006573 [Gaertneriomyces sp. JEL0708]
MDSFPLDDKVRKSTIETFRRTLEGQYAFLDMASVGSTIDQGKWDVPDVDLRKVLKEAESKAYKNDREFHDEMALVFRLVGDAHTGYRSGCYHSAFSFYHPWSYNVLVSTTTGQQHVQLGSLTSTDTAYTGKVSEAIGRAPADLIGWTITSIDGEAPVTWIMKFADSKVGLAKDAQIRFNRATARLGVNPDGSIRSSAGPVSLSSGMEAPPKPTRHIVVQSPDGKETLDLQVPWLAKKSASTPTFVDAASFYSNVCLAQNAGFESLALDVDVSRVDITKEELIPAATTLIYPNTTENSYGNGYPKTVHSGELTSFYMIDETTGVASVPTFSNGGDEEKCKARIKDPGAVAAIGTGGPAGPTFFCFIMEMNDGYQALKAAGAQKLILDWTDNGGGWGDLGFATVALLFPDVVRDQARFRMSPFAEALFKDAFEKDLNQTEPLTMFGPANFLDPKTGSIPLPEDAERLFLSSEAGRTETYGQYSGRYSDLVSIVDGGGIFDDTREHNTWNATGIAKPTQPLFPVQNVILMTNGLCGSTCAHAARLAVDHVGIRSLVKGGLANSKPFTFSTFPGGNVVDIPQIFTDLQKLGLDKHELAPQPFLNRVSMWRVNAGVGYSKRQDLPAEYAYAPADCRMDITEETFFPPNSWRAAIPYFEGCRGGSTPTPTPTPDKCKPLIMQE